METRYVRLKPYEPRRGHVLRRFTFRGIKFQEERGWYCVKPEVAAYLAEVRQEAADPHSPLAFDVCSLEEAQALDGQEASEAKVRKGASEELKVSREREAEAEGTVKSEDLPEKKAGKKR